MGVCMMPGLHTTVPVCANVFKSCALRYGTRSRVFHAWSFVFVVFGYFIPPWGYGLEASDLQQCVLEAGVWKLWTNRTYCHAADRFYKGGPCFFWVPASMLSSFSDFLLLCFSASLLTLLLWFSAFLLLCFSASLLILLLCFSCFSAFLLLCFLLSCFSAFPASLLFAFPASLLFCFSVFPASLLLYFCAFLLLLFYFFFSPVMCFCCSTSCSFAFLLPVFTVSLFFIFFCFILFCVYPKWNPREALGETQRNPKEILIRNPTWSPKWTLKKP